MTWLLIQNYLIKNEYGTKSKCKATENTQENSILEIIHQVIANLIRTFDLQNNYLNKDNPWLGIVEAMDFSVHIMHHKTSQIRRCLDVR